MKPVVIIGGFVFVMVMLYFAGSFVSTETCINIGGHDACWNDFAIEVRNSPLCSANVCVAEPFAQQHNAFVDAMLLACADAQSVGYSDSQLNAEITLSFSNLLGSPASVQEICSLQGTLLAKLSYD